MLHSVFLLAFVLIAGPLAAYIPLAALAVVLAVVAWNMVERHAIERAYAGDSEDKADQGPGRTPYDPAMATDPDVVVYRLSGALFFGAAARVGAVLGRVVGHPHAYVVDISAVPMLDSTAAATMENFAAKARRHRPHVRFSAVVPFR